MKNILFILILKLIILNSCTTKNENCNNNLLDFEYSILGEVSSGEGSIVELILSDDIDNPMFSKIIDGKFLISSTSDHVQEAKLRIKGSRAFLKIIIEPGILKFKFEVNGENPNYSFVKSEVIEGANNSYIFEFSRELWKATDIDTKYLLSRNDSIKMDSIQKFVFPVVRSQVFELYESRFKNTPRELKLILLKFLTEQLDENGYMNKIYLNDSERNLLKKYFSMIDSSITHHQEYQNIQTSISMIDDVSSKIIFHDYELEGINGKREKLSDLIKENKYTVIDFWWHGCGPCRKFNMEMKSHYEQLKKDGIEIVSISFDRSKQDWKTASNNDKINWKNLFAGPNTDIKTIYKIKRFPTYIVLDENLSVVDISIKSKVDILNLVKN